MKFGAFWVKCWTLALTNFGRDPCSSDSWSAKRTFVLCCQVSNTRFCPFLVGQISRNLNTTGRTVRRWKLSEQNFENFTVRGRFSKKRKDFFKSFNVLWHHAAITPQWLQIAGNSLPNDPSTGGLVSIFYHWNKFRDIPWPVHSVQEPPPKKNKFCDVRRRFTTRHVITCFCVYERK